MGTMDTMAGREGRRGGVLSFSFTFIRNKMGTDWSSLLWAASISILPAPQSLPCGKLLISVAQSPARQSPGAQQINYSQFAQEGSEHNASQQVPFLKMTKVIYVSPYMLQKLSPPCRGEIKWMLCAPGTGTAFAQCYQSSERPYGFW